MRRPFNGMFPITQEWGVNPQDYSQFGLSGHNGVDYGTTTGTPILTPHNGQVIEAEFDAKGYGKYVKIENDIEGSILAHLQSFNVNIGDTVSEGQQVGVSDSTGNSTGPHLHWGYYRKPRNKSDGYSGTTNPYTYLSENNTTIPPWDDCPIKLKQVTEERDRLNGVITGKDKEIADLKAKDANYEALVSQANGLAVQLQSCQQTSNLYKAEYDAATSPTGYKAQIIQLEQTKKNQANDITKLTGDVTKLQNKFDNTKKPVQKLIIAIAEKLGVQL